jgi:hypothetical protein
MAIWSQFNSGVPSPLESSDIVVGLRGGANFQFSVANLFIGFGAGTGTLGIVQGDGSNIASGNYSWAIGDGSNTAAGINALAFGTGNSAPQPYGFAFGLSCVTDEFAMAFGDLCQALDVNAMAIGTSCIANGANSWAIGNMAVANYQGSVVWGGSATPDQDTATNQFCLTFNSFRLFNGSVNINTAGKGLAIAEGSNAKQGVSTLVSGTVTVANTSVTSTSRIFPAAQDANTVGTLHVVKTPGTGFVITSSNNADHGVVAWIMTEVAA